MKATRKLIPAIAMLLISAVMMSTATFAWFSTNTTAIASGFEVQIAAAKNLLIKDSAATAYKSSVTYTDASKLSLSPASTDPTSINNTDQEPTFYSVADAGDMDPDNYAAAADTTFAETTDNYVKKTVKLNATGEYDEGKDNFGNVSAEIVIGGSSVSPVMPSLRVLLVVTQGTNTSYYIYTPVSGATAGYKPVNGTTSTSLGDAISTVSNDSSPIITGIEKETEYTVDVYIWFEGQDESCKATNAIQLDETTVTIKFNLVAA